MIEYLCDCMKKGLLVLIGCLSIGLCASYEGRSFISADDSNKAINDILKEYYNEGEYTRRTWINFSDEAMKDSLENYFVANKISLERTTYFSGETLLMGNIDGSIGGEKGINSGYTTIDNSLYHYVLDEYSNTIVEDSLVLNVKDTSVTNFFVTMKTFSDNYVTGDWVKDGNIYRYDPLDTSFNLETKKYNDPVLDDFLMFTASCFYNTNSDNLHYIGLDYVEIEEVDSHLELRLYADELDYGKLNNNDNLLSVAKVYKGFLPKDNTGDYLVVDDQYYPIINNKLEDVFITKNSSILYYNSNGYFEQKSDVKVNGYYNVLLDENNDVDLTLIYEEIPNRIYEDPNDSLEGIDEKDLSLLKNAFDKVTNNYTLTTRTYFNRLAVSRVNKIYNTTYLQSKITKVNQDAIFIYDEIGQTNEYYIYQDGLQVGKLKDGIVSELSPLVKEQVVNQSLKEYFYTMENLNSKYIDTYGPCVVKYTSSYSVEYDGWTRISENKFKCDREEVLAHFLKFLAPGFTNGGTYMTYRYVTIELLNDDTIKIRLYASPTQSGKMIEEHLDKENKPDWYLLFAEGYITDINSTII